VRSTAAGAGQADAGVRTGRGARFRNFKQLFHNKESSVRSIKDSLPAYTLHDGQLEDLRHTSHELSLLVIFLLRAATRISLLRFRIDVDNANI